MYDGDNNTYWHSNWGDGSGNNMPQFIKIDLASTTEIGGFEYTPRPDRNATALKSYRIYITDVEISTPENYNGGNAEHTAALSEESLSDYAANMVKGTISIEGNGAKSVYFPSNKTGRYVLLVADLVGNNATSGFFCCSELNLFAGLTEVEAARLALQDVIANAEPWGEKEGIGYGDAVFQTALATAQTVVVGKDAEAMNAAKTALESAMSEHIAMPEAGKYYFIVSTFQRFATEKAMYGSNDSKVYWKGTDKSDVNFYWSVSSSSTPNRYNVVNAVAQKSMNGFSSDHLILGDAKDVELKLLAPGEFNINVGGTCHAFAHTNGAGTGDRVCSWSGAANSASAWTFIEATETEVTNVLNAFVTPHSAYVEKYQNKNSANPTEIGWVSAEAYNAYGNAVNDFKANPALDKVASLETAYESLFMSKVMPVFTITNCRSTTLGKAIIEDNENDMNHFTAVSQNNKDGRIYWAIDFEENTARIGDFRAYNLLSKKNLRSRNSQSDMIKVELTTTDGVTDQFIITQNGSSPLHAEAATGNVVTWNDRNANDGSAWKINYVGTTADLPVEALQTYKSSVIPFYTECQSIKSQNRYTDALNAYTLKGYDGGYDALVAYDATLTATAENIAAISEIVNGCSNTINVPADGSFIRVRNTDMGMAYLLGNNNSTVDGKTTRAAFAGGSNNTSTVFYYKNGKLLSYASGEYLANNSNFAGFAGVNEGTDIAFNKSVNITQGTYLVGFNNNNRMLYAHADGYSDAGGYNANETNKRYQYWLESVTALGVNVKAYGFATLNSPVALTIPKNVTAVYTGKKDESGNYLVLTSLSGTIPANTPVIIEAAEGSYDFNISSEAGTPVAENDLRGTLASENLGGGVLTLQNIEEKPGFYTYTGSVLKGFKAYLNGANEIRGFIINDATGITNPDNNNVKAPVTLYDLSGRRVNKAGKGIYIMNGKKVVLD